MLEAIVERIPPPKPGKDASARGLVFDSKYDAFRGVVVYVRLFSGSLKPGEKVRMMGTNMDYEIKEVGIFAPNPTPVKKLDEGTVGYVIANIKDASEIQIGDTMTSARHPGGLAAAGL